LLLLVLLVASSEGDEDAEAAAVSMKRQGQRRRRTKESTRVVVFVAPRVRRVPETAKAAVVERERGMIVAGLCDVLGGGGAGCRQTRKGKVVRFGVGCSFQDDAVANNDDHHQAAGAEEAK